MQTYERLDLLLRQPRDLIGRLALANHRKTGEHRLYFLAPGASCLQMSEHLRVLVRRDYVSYVVSPLCDIEMAHLTHI